MANRLKGITLEIGGDTTELSKSLSAVNKDIKSTQAALKDVNKLLKMDPGNAELLQQKYKLLTDQVKQTKDKLSELKDAQTAMDARGVDKASDEYMNLRREIIDTEMSLRDLEKAASDSNSTLAKVGDTADKLSQASGKVASATKGISTAAAGGLAAIGGLAVSAMKGADDLNTMAKQTGFSVEELQKFTYASDLVDVSVENITGALAKMKKGMGETGIAVGDMVISTTDASGQMRDATDVFYDVLDALSKIPNETERDQAAMAVFGKSADQLAGIVDDGGAALRAYGDEAERLGLIMSGDTLNSLNEANDKVDKLKATAKATLAETGANALQALLPVLERIIDFISKLLAFIGKLGPGAIGFLTTILAIVAAISPIAGMISKISGAVSTLLPVLSVIKTFLLANPFTIWAALGIAAVLAMVAIFRKYGDQIKKFFSDIWNGIKTLLQNIVNFAKSIFDRIADLISGAFSKISDKINSIKNLASSVGSAIGNFFGFGSRSGGIPAFAEGGTLYKGTALVGEAGPELLTVQGGKATVTPLTATIDSKSMAALAGNSQPVNASFTINFAGDLAQLGKVLNPVIVSENNRLGPSLISH